MRAIILPGRAYTPAMALLAAADRSLVRHGYDVHQVWWEAPEPTEAFVRRHLVAAAADAPRVLVVAKSLGTRAASYAAERSWPAIWLTPLLHDDACVAGIRANTAPQLLVGGLDDHLWDTEVAADLAGPDVRVLEIPEADHALSVPDAVRSAEIHVEVARAVDGFLQGLPE